MVVEINCAHRHFYYEFRDDVALKAYELQLEFGRWRHNIKGNHPFLTYWETIDSDGSTSFAGYVHSYGPDDFVAWLNVEIYKTEVAKEIDPPPALPAAVALSF